MWAFDNSEEFLLLLTVNDLFEPDIQQNMPKIAKFWPFSSLKMSKKYLA